MNFDKAFELVIGAEGGYTKDPNDRGNWTGGDGLCCIAINAPTATVGLLSRGAYRDLC